MCKPKFNPLTHTREVGNRREILEAVIEILLKSEILSYQDYSDFSCKITEIIIMCLPYACVIACVSSAQGSAAVSCRVSCKQNCRIHRQNSDPNAQATTHATLSLTKTFRPWLIMIVQRIVSVCVPRLT